MRKKWTNVNKDPVKGMKDDFMNRHQYWGTLNHLPAKGVEKVVTDKILAMDKESCDRILQGILEEKQIDDFKREQQASLRNDLREKLSQRHRQTMDLEIRS